MNYFLLTLSFFSLKSSYFSFNLKSNVTFTAYFCLFVKKNCERGQIWIYYFFFSSFKSQTDRLSLARSFLFLRLHQTEFTSRMKCYLPRAEYKGKKKCACGEYFSLAYSIVRKYSLLCCDVSVRSSLSCCCCWCCEHFFLTYKSRGFERKSEWEREWVNRVFDTPYIVVSILKKK
jgi:hypothetical protein